MLGQVQVALGDGGFTWGRPEGPWHWIYVWYLGSFYAAAAALSSGAVVNKTTKQLTRSHFEVGFPYQGRFNSNK